MTATSRGAVPREALAVGQFVLADDDRGVARVGEIDGTRVRLEWFESAADLVAATEWFRGVAVERFHLGKETRVYWRDPISDRWRFGRVVAGGPDCYFVRVPNGESDLEIPESRLRVRWERPVADPLQLLLVGAQESPHYRDARIPVLCANVEERAACASLSGVISARVDLHAHQIDAAMRVLADPVQRYLLADEVGLGKTIESGFVIRQRFLDDPSSKVVVVVPEALRRQWRDEMAARFFLEDFPYATFEVASHDTPGDWRRFRDFDLVVVDEAQHLVRDDPTARPYPELRDLCHAVPRVLLLSATPVLQHVETHLGLLHLLDGDLYRWQDLDAFRRKLEMRRELARGVFALDPEFSFLLPGALDDLRALLPVDQRFEQLAAAVLGHLDHEGNVLPEEPVDQVALAVDAVRAHISETYRLHRRVIRHRRAAVVDVVPDDDGLLPEFEVTGRRRPTVVALSSAEHLASITAVQDWQVAVRDAALDGEADLAAYAGAYAALVARTGGPATDLRSALRWRLDGDARAAAVCGLSWDETRALQAAPVLPAERAIAAALADAEADGLEEVVSRLVDALQGSRVVVFAGPGTLAGAVAAALAVRGVPDVYEHLSATRPDLLERAVIDWRTSGGTLVCDSSADDGRNFQAADCVVHVRLPTNPNALEQRIGRVDRYGRRRSARQVVLGDGTSSVVAAWRDLLVQTYAVFDRSISTLQDAVARDLSTVWLAALEDGEDGVDACRPRIEKTLTDELQALDELDLLESTDARAGEVRDPAADIARHEDSRGGDRKSFLDLLRGVEGLRMSVRHRSSGCVEVEPGWELPLLSPRLLTRLGGVPAQSRRAFVDRWLAEKHGGRLFRVGNPLVDAVASILDLDDRGRASAHWRVDPSWQSTTPLPYLGLVYLVEADLSAALDVVGEDAAVPPLRRRADRAFAPFVRRIWLPADDEVAVDDPRLLRWLESPYRNHAGDRNLNAARVGVLHDLYGGEEAFVNATVAAEVVARRELVRVTDLRSRCTSAADALRRESAVLRAQADARAAAGRLVGEDESLVLDRRLNEALLHGVDHPRVQLLAVTCLVRSRSRWDSHAP